MIMTLDVKKDKRVYLGWGHLPGNRRVGEGWVLGEAGEVQAVIIDGTSAELQVSVTSLLS